MGKGAARGGRERLPFSDEEESGNAAAIGEGEPLARTHHEEGRRKDVGAQGGVGDYSYGAVKSGGPAGLRIDQVTRLLGVAGRGDRASGSEKAAGRRATAVGRSDDDSIEADAPRFAATRAEQRDLSSEIEPCRNDASGAQGRNGAVERFPLAEGARIERRLRRGKRQRSGAVIEEDAAPADS